MPLLWLGVRGACARGAGGSAAHASIASYRPYAGGFQGYNLRNDGSALRGEERSWGGGGGGGARGTRGEGGVSEVIGAGSHFKCLFLGNLNSQDNAKYHTGKRP